jgi:hypothetical protein
VQRRVDRRPRRELLSRQALHHLLERERVVPEPVADRLDICERRLSRLVVGVDRRRLAEAGHAFVLKLDLDHVRGVLRPACDRERLGQLQGDDPGAQLHAGTLRPATRL